METSIAKKAITNYAKQKRFTIFRTVQLDTDSESSSEYSSLTDSSYYGSSSSSGDDSEYKTCKSNESGCETFETTEEESKSENSQKDKESPEKD